MGARSAAARTDRIAVLIRQLEKALAKEAKRSPSGKISGKPELLEFASKLLERYEPSEAFRGEDGIARTNNAATAVPMVAAVQATLGSFLGYGPYGGRQAGGKEIASRAAKDRRTVEYGEMVNRYRAAIERFVGMDSEKDALIYALNTSDAVGKLAISCGYSKDDVVLVPRMEHTSNNLPWMLRSGARVVRVEQTREGEIDLADLERKLAEHGGRVKLVAFTAASNITGIRPDVKKIVSLAHKYGALAAVDCAQHAPHFPMDKKGWGADFVYFSGHKLGAPNGPGVLAAPIKWLEEHVPAIPGGGTIENLITDGKLDRIVWAPLEAKHQPGTWMTTGICALGAVCETIMDRIGWEGLVEKEHELLKYAYKRLSKIPGFEPLPVKPSRYESEYLTPVISFNLKGYSPDELLQALADEGIQVRGGSTDPICNHDYIRNVLGLEGMVRVSFAFHNTKEDVDRVAEVLAGLSAGRPL